MKSTIEKRKVDLAKKILSTENEKILKKVESLLNTEEIKWWDDLNEFQQESINESLRQSSKGEVISHQEARKIINQWISK